MRRYIIAFVHRGMSACGFGPIVLAFLYLILRRFGAIEMLTVQQVCLGIFSLSVLAFLAGGMNVIYQIEHLPLMVAILIHGCVLYIGYLATYLLNGWLEWGTMPILIFTAFFVFGYFLIWMIIYTVTKRNAAKVNAMLKEKQNRE